MIVLTHIKRALVYLVSAGLWLVALSVQGHPGRTDAEGCHAPAHSHGIAVFPTPVGMNRILDKLVLSDN